MAGGVDAAAEQIKAKQYAEPFQADKRKVIALAIELDELGKGLIGKQYKKWRISRILRENAPILCYSYHVNAF